MKYTCLIIGCGSIGALKDDKFDSPKTNEILTHAHAITNNKYLNLIGVMDISPIKGQEAAKKWRTKYYENYPTDVNVDVVVISTPTKTHLNIIKQVKLYLNPKLIIGEKPLGKDINECIKIISESSSPILVNYSRRFNKVHQEIAKSMNYISKNKKVYSCVIYYGRGLSHDGCHALDLMNWWFGECLSIKKTNYVNDGFGDTWGLIAKYKKCENVIFIPIDYHDFGIFDIEITTSIGKYFLVNNGNKLYLKNIKNGDKWGNYPVLAYNIHNDGKFKTYLTETLKQVYNNVVKFLDNKEQLKCNMSHALDVWKIYNMIDF